jgi:hypothetical protein
MKYYLFIDESGDHGLANIDPDFSVFVLCGVIFSESEYQIFRERVNKLKVELWGSIGVIFHSRDIRKHEKEFQIFFDMEKKRIFYDQINSIIAESGYSIIASAIQKEEFIKKYGKLSNVYSISLSFILERTIFFLDRAPDASELEIIVEKRGRAEDLVLSQHYNDIHSIGTYYVTPERIQFYKTKLKFTSKKENINGLQLADLAAYPIARHIIEPERVNLAYDILVRKFYEDDGDRHGLKIYP